MTLDSLQWVVISKFIVKICLLQTEDCSPKTALTSLTSTQLSSIFEWLYFYLVNFRINFGRHILHND